MAKLMALAIRFATLIRDGVVTDYAELARLGHVSRARITQIINLLNITTEERKSVKPRRQRVIITRGGILQCRHRFQLGNPGENIPPGRTTHPGGTTHHVSVCRVADY